MDASSGAFSEMFRPTPNWLLYKAGILQPQMCGRFSGTMQIIAFCREAHPRKSRALSLTVFIARQLRLL